jgi:hypothetical protein
VERVAYWAGFDAPEQGPQLQLEERDPGAASGTWERRILLVGVVGGLLAVVLTAGLVAGVMVILLTLGLARLIGKGE